MTLDIGVNTILSLDMDINSIKELIRKYSKKNNYKFVRQIMESLTNYSLNPEPLPSSLAYNSSLTLHQEPPFKLVLDKMKHVFEYREELLVQLTSQV